MNEKLFEKLQSYSEGDIYPLHMPGHKRHPYKALPADIAAVDITEIEGFDNLNHPENIYIELQKHASDLYGAYRAFFLVNGSTAGILASISALVPEEGTLLTVRNAHRSVYNAACLHRVNLEYISPREVDGTSIPEAVTAGQVESALKASRADAVLIVSPTYEGRIADIKAIVDVVHGYNIPLIVDCAHGAHFGLYDFTPENPCALGADAVIVSTHKTLPALTQTGILLIGNNKYEEKIQMYLSMYQTSSPSYILTSSIDNALYISEDKEAQHFFKEAYEKLVCELRKLKHICVPLPDEDQDIGKLVVSVRENRLTGSKLAEILLKNYKLQCEMAGRDYVLLMFTVSDTPEAYKRLLSALRDVDSEIENNTCNVTQMSEDASSYTISVLSSVFGAIPIYSAYNSEFENMLLKDSLGRVSASYVCAYPPGTPIVVPGEIIDSNVIKEIEMKLNAGLNLQGLTVNYS